ncbi:MAG: response regulator [Erythrobacter sp.]|nr:response regulator [Erythrobacter sp.]NCQ62753.1 response regulator [Alphaproteobacteria bacterium]
MARIIIADDDPIMVAIVRQILEPHGHIIGALGDGMQVREVLENKQPDLLILDCTMPGKSGIVALREVRSSTKCRRIPVLMLTARRSAEDEHIGYHTGADDYLMKPFDPDLLVFRVEQLLEKGSRMANMPTSVYG